jgi:ABC-type multidrug transport system fused ATPase/permease subunit
MDDDKARPPGRQSPLAAARTALATWRRLSPFFVGSRGQIVLIAVVSVFSGLAEAVLLTLIAAIAMSLAEQRGVVDIEMFGVTLSGAIMPVIIASILFAVVRGALQLWVAHLPAKMSGQAMVDLRTRLFDAFVRAAWPVKASEREGGFQAVMINQVRATAESVILMSVAISSLFMFLTLLVSAVAMSVTAALVITGVSLILFAALRPMSRVLQRTSKTLSSENIEYAKSTQEVAALAEETQVFGASETYRDRFYAQLRAVQRPFERVRFLSAAVPSLYQSVALLVLVLALAVVALLGTGNVATLGAVVLILVRAVTYGQRVQTAITSFDEKVPFMQHLADAIERYEAHPQRRGAAVIPGIDTLSMDGVSYAYGDGQAGIRDMTFEVGMGEIIGIVGPSGAGKSTLVQILLRLREPDSGSYLVNGVDATEVRAADWHNLVSYVPQVPQLIYGTVRDNIRFFRDCISDADTERAAKQAHIHEEILSLPHGYDTMIGARASAVSGGQRQRICLARALAANPTVIILDEPTSALDVKSEGAVQTSLQELSGRSIVFLVAHRLSTLAICDRVMVVADGRLEAFDTAERLVEENPYFWEVNAINGSAGDEGERGTP